MTAAWPKKYRSRNGGDSLGERLGAFGVFGEIHRLRVFQRKDGNGGRLRVGRTRRDAARDVGGRRRQRWWLLEAAGAALAGDADVLRRVLDVRSVRGVPRTDSARPWLSHVIRSASHQLGVPGTAVLLAGWRHCRRLSRSKVSLVLHQHCLVTVSLQGGAERHRHVYTLWLKNGPMLHFSRKFNKSNQHQ